MNPVHIVTTALVVLTLAFVHVTDAVGPRWLAPMYALTFTATWTVRWRDRRAWRAAWNIALLAIFGLLLRDFLTTGPRHLLEGGLTLAAFCQVHLLNALRRGQRPDLLFFNSFLIALVTSFFCQDLAYSLIFAVYAPTFLIALQFAAAGDGEALEHRVARTLTKDGARRAVVVLAVTGLVFAVWPRDFRRPGLLDDDGWIERLTGTSTTGFAEEVRLGRSAHTTVDDRIVFRIRPLEGPPERVPAHWRGATMSSYDRHGWRRAPGSAIGLLDALRTPWKSIGTGEWRRAADLPPTGRASIIARSAPSGRVLLPLGSQVLRIAEAMDVERVRPLADGTIRHEARRGSVNGPVGEVTFGPETGIRSRLRARESLLRVDRTDPDAVPPAIHDLVEEIRTALPPQATDALIAERSRALIASRFEYLLPGQPGAAESLDAFVAGEGGGHCELFATTLGVALRLQGVPCRLASGYLVHEWDEGRNEFVVRAAHAHAWVEWWDDDRSCFVTADPTPAASADADQHGDSWWSVWTGELSTLWTRLTRFDAEDRRALLEGVAALPAAIAAIAREHPLKTTAALALLILTLVNRARRRSRREPAVVAYERVLRRAGLAPRPGETPRELATRARDAVPPRRYEELLRATETHERSRFA